MKCSPIILFTYNRLDETQLAVDSLLKNSLASRSNLYIFSDGPANESDALKVNAVRSYLKKINGFQHVEIIEKETNLGLANSVIQGVTEIMNDYDKVIVLEDDLVVSVNFLDFMNQALDFYNSHPNIFSISGYTLDLPKLKDYPFDYYAGYRASSWGWGTWKNIWNEIDWEINDYNKFKYNFLSQIRFSRGGSDMPRMLKKQMNGKIDSWAIRWCYNQYKRNLVTIFPSKSKLVSIGAGDSATHTKSISKFQTKIDSTDKKIFKFSSDIVLDKRILNQFRSKFSFYSRIKDKFNL